MKCIVYSAKSYDEEFLSQSCEGTDHELFFVDVRLNQSTTFLAQGRNAVCCFVNDQLNREVLESLKGQGIQMVALRCAGFNQIDLECAKELRIKVARVPAYSPHAVAEHTLGLILTLNRKIHRAYSRVRDNNFALEGLMGFDLFEKTVGVIGTGAIGACVAHILRGFGCHVLLCDPYPNPELVGVGEYVSRDRILRESDVITLHCPLSKETYHMIDEASVESMKSGVMLINTSRGALVDTRAIIQGLKAGKIGGVGLDVYEEESHLFFEDFSTKVVQDDVFSRLLTFPNVLITAHQAFFTREALREIARVTMANLSDFEAGRSSSRFLA